MLADRVGIVDYDDADGPDVLRAVHLLRHFHFLPPIEQDDVAADVLLVHQAARAAAAQPGSSRLRFTERGRWGLDLNLSQPVGRESNLGDVEAGAYYRVNPRLRVGATAGLAEPESDPARAPQTDRRAAPRFRLESIFRF